MKPEDIADIVADAIRPLIERVKNLERENEALKIDLKSLKEIPAPKDGKDGVGIKDLMIDESGVLCVTLSDGQTKRLTRVVGKDGRDGIDGKDGVGKDGKDGVGIKDLMIDESGVLCVTLSDGQTKRLTRVVGKDGRDGIDGKDGIGLAGAIIDQRGNLLLTLSNGELKDLDRVVGKDGRDGKDGEPGKDGVSLDSFEMGYIEETHEIEIKAKAGERIKTLRYPAGGIRTGGYWRDGVTAKAGSCWSDAGSLYIALKDTSTRPSINAASDSPDWLLAARKGRDGQTAVKYAGNDEGKPVKLRGAQ